MLALANPLQSLRSGQWTSSPDFPKAMPKMHSSQLRISSPKQSDCFREKNSSRLRSGPEGPFQTVVEVVLGCLVGRDPHADWWYVPGSLLPLLQQMKVVFEHTQGVDHFECGFVMVNDYFSNHSVNSSSSCYSVNRFENGNGRKKWEKENF